MNEEFITHVINFTEIHTICVSKITINFVFDLKVKNKIGFVKNLILFDDDYSISDEQFEKAGLKLIRYKELLDKG